jgi:hypothetical protein
MFSRLHGAMYLLSWLVGCLQVLSSQVDWRAGKADLWVNKEWGFDLAAVASKLALDGYDIQVLLNRTIEGKAGL